MREKEISDLAFITEGIVNLKNKDPKGLKSDRLQLIQILKKRYPVDRKTAYIHEALVSMESAIRASTPNERTDPLSRTIKAMARSPKLNNRIVGRTLEWSVSNKESQKRMAQKAMK